MTGIATVFSDIDKIRILRARELSELKVRMKHLRSVPRFGVRSKAVIVLSYAHWEGFYNDCVLEYITFLKESRKSVQTVSWPMLVGLLQPDFQRLRDRNHSHKAMVHFTKSLELNISKDFREFDAEVVLARSNLDFSKVRNNFEVLGLDCARLQRWRLKIDNELVGWRHGVAHGSDPDLSLVSIDEHVSFTQEMLLLLSDLFQEKITRVSQI